MELGASDKAKNKKRDHGVLMKRCKHYNVCGLDADADPSASLCILHSADPNKDKQAFSSALDAHQKEHGANFSRFVFPSYISFGVQVTKDGRLLEATPLREPSFFYARFLGGAHFGGATFSQSVSFASAIFYGEAYFVGAKFADFAGFGGATFKDEANFNTAKFNDGGSFSSATFTEMASFYSAEFRNEVRFDDAEFFGESHFTSANFDWCSFQGVKLTKQSKFDGAKFKEDIDFQKARFLEETSFAGASFSRKVDFRKSQFAKLADFVETKFSDQVDFSEVTFSVADFGRSTFGEEANFRGASFLEHAQFPQVTFSGNANFGSTTFRKRANFRGATFGKGANFRESLFAKESVNLRSCSFLGRTIFTGRKQGGRTAQLFSDVKVDFREVEIDPPDALVFRDADLSGCRLLETDLHKIELTSVTWPTTRSRFGIERIGVYDEIAPPGKNEPRLWDHTERLYRDLKKNYEQKGDHERAGDFHYGEKEMRRKNPETSPMLRFFLTVYWLISGYGERYIRPLVSALVLLVACTVGYLLLGIAPVEGSPLKLANLRAWLLATSLYSLQIMTLLKPTDMQTIGLAATALKIFQSIVGPVIIAFFALALRQRLKR